MVKVRIGIAPLQKTLRGIERQSKFASAQALNELVEVIKLRSIDRLPKYFRIRSGYLARGFRTQHALRDRLVAWVGHLEKFLEAQAVGGTKDPRDSSIGQAVPQKGTAPGSIPMPRGTSGERPTYRGSNWPRQLVKAVELYEKKIAASRGKKAGSKSHTRAVNSAMDTRAASNRLVFLRHARIPTLAIRIGKGQGRGNYLPLWFLTKAPVKIPKRWKFFEDGESFARSNFTPMMDFYLTKSLANMRTS